VARAFFSSLMAVLLASTPTIAGAHRTRVVLTLSAPVLALRFDNARLSISDTPPPRARPLLNFVGSALEFHAGRVEHALIFFQPAVSPPSRVPAADRDHEASEVKLHSWAKKRAATELDVRRQYERLLLFRPTHTNGAATGLGAAMFASMTFLAAHAPRPLRVLFDRRVHLGPAIFDGDGMGVGLSGWIEKDGG